MANLTEQQIETLDILLVEQSYVIDRVYFDHRHNTVNFRSRFTTTGRFTEEQNRLAIMPNGTIVNRNTRTYDA